MRRHLCSTSRLVAEYCGAHHQFYLLLCKSMSELLRHLIFQSEQEIRSFANNYRRNHLGMEKKVQEIELFNLDFGWPQRRTIP